MKRQFILLLAPLLFALSSCEDEVYNHPQELQHHWIITNEEAAQEPMSLTFTDDYLEVEHGLTSLPPFGFGSSEWEYNVEQDSILYIWRSDTYYDEDDSYTTYQEEAFIFHVTPDNRLLDLYYYEDILFSANLHHYTFLQRY